MVCQPGSPVREMVMVPFWVTLCIGDQIGDNLDQPFRISRDFRESGLCRKDQLIVLWAWMTAVVFFYRIQKTGQI